MHGALTVAGAVPFAPPMCTLPACATNLLPHSHPSSPLSQPPHPTLQAHVVQSQEPQDFVEGGGDGIGRCAACWQVYTDIFKLEKL